MQRDNRYQRGKVYQIICNVTGLCYIGSTIQTLSARMTGHRSDYKKHLNGAKVYCKSFIILENNDYRTELICEYPCWSKMELCREEGKYQRKIECVNTKIAGRIKTEYYQDNKDKIKQRDIRYRRDNKDNIKEREAKRYHDNKDEIKQRQSVKYNCECGSSLSMGCKARHNRTKKHQDYINSL